MAVCEPSEVLAEAKCFDCLSPKSLLVAQTVLLSQATGSSPPPPEGDMQFEDDTQMDFEDDTPMEFES